MDMQLTDEQIIEAFAAAGITFQEFYSPRKKARVRCTEGSQDEAKMIAAVRALLTQQVEAAQWVSVKERLPAPLLAFDDWLNAPPSREVTEPTEVRIYRFEAYRRWQEALTAVRALSSSPAEQKGNV